MDCEVCSLTGRLSLVSRRVLAAVSREHRVQLVPGPRLPSLSVQPRDLRDSAFAGSAPGWERSDRWPRTDGVLRPAPQPGGGGAHLSALRRADSAFRGLAARAWLRRSAPR